VNDAFTQALGDRRGADTATVASSTTPHVRAQQLVRRLTEEPATSRTSTPAERLHAACKDHQLSASELGTRPVSHGFLAVFELAGRYSAKDPSERCWQGLMVWREGAGWELFERAVAS
jgi:hypothetical protein